MDGSLRHLNYEVHAPEKISHELDGHLWRHAEDLWNFHVQLYDKKYIFDKKYAIQFFIENWYIKLNYVM